MAAPFDDQLILDLPQAGTYTPLSGATQSPAGTTVQETGVSPVQAGLFSLVARDARITFGMTQFTGRPAEGASYTAADGIVWQLISVVKRELANFWDCAGRSFSVPGGLTQTGTLQRRNSDTARTSGLNAPTWSNLTSSIACRLMNDAQEIDFTASPVGTEINAHALCAGYREIRSGDRFVVSGVTWDVTGAEPYDTTMGVQILRLTQRK